MSRPEHIAPPELFYDDKEAGKYTSNSRIMTIQTAMAERCIELLNFETDEPKLLLDIGCGSGISGEVITDCGHMWTGLDISSSMLEIAAEKELEGDLLLNDMGNGFGFRSGVFDGAISVSAVQWLFYSDRKDHRSSKRLMAFFTSLYRSLRRGARAALQFYPESSDQLELVTAAALRCGFSGGLVVDFPNSTKAKKYYLCLFAGVDPSVVKMPAAKLSEAAAAGVGDAVGPAHEHRRHAKKAARKGARQAVKSRDWVMEQKDSRRRKGLEVRPDTKYTGRSRGIKF